MQSSCIILILTIIQNPIRTIKNEGGYEYTIHVTLKQLSKSTLRLWVSVVFKAIIAEFIFITSSQAIFTKNKLPIMNFEIKILHTEEHDPDGLLQVQQS